MKVAPDQFDSSQPDPFAVLGLPRRFDLDIGAIESAFLSRLSGVHPDLAGEGASFEAADLMDAKATIENPERRATMLLELLGGPSASDDKSLPDGYLMEMMELRGEIEEQLGSDSDARTRWQSFADERRAEHIKRVSELFSPSSVDDDGLRLIRTELNAWRYTERLIEQLDPGYDPAQADGMG